MDEIRSAEFTCKPIVKILDKAPEDFQRKDIMEVIRREGINQINLHYVGLDGKLKELKVPVNSLQYADLVLAQGERIDGSSIFKGIVDTANSDKYVVPVYKTAFISPFEDKTLGVLCRFLDKDGQLTKISPDNIVLDAHASLKNETGYSLNALGELEFYLIYEQQNHLFPAMSQRGYHQSSPFVKSGKVLNEMMKIISSLTASVKYAHSEVGYIETLKSKEVEVSGRRCEQYEIEFLPRPIEDMGGYLALAKWVIRNVAYKFGCAATFTPKLEEGMAGNGLHFHLELQKNGQNVMTGADGSLSTEAQKLIGGLCHFAPSLTAFGNSVSSAHLRLVTNQEAPTKICWSDCNRAALVRVPLGWTNVGDMAKLVNPGQEAPYEAEIGNRQTVEFRSPDGSAYIDMLLAAMTMATKHGLTANDSLDIAKKLRVDENIVHNKKLYDSLESLPGTCFDSAEALQRSRELYEKGGVFPPALIDYVIGKLREEKDRDINERYTHLTADQRLQATRDIMHKDLHKH
jgi:glutamine synthetase